MGLHFLLVIFDLITGRALKQSKTSKELSRRWRQYRPGLEMRVDVSMLNKWCTTALMVCFCALLEVSLLSMLSTLSATNYIAFRISYQCISCIFFYHY